LSEIIIIIIIIFIINIIIFIIISLTSFTVGYSEEGRKHVASTCFLQVATNNRLLADRVYNMKQWLCKHSNVTVSIIIETIELKCF